MKIFLTIILSMTFTSCSNLTLEQLQFGHEIYHTLSKKPCIFVVDEGK